MNPAQTVPVTGRSPPPTRTTTRCSEMPPFAPWSTWHSGRGHPYSTSPSTTSFLGSCTNGRIEDLRAAAKVIEGRKVDSRVSAVVVPGSMQVRPRPSPKALDQVFEAAGFSWRDAGCSSCLAMNP